ncbi:hypothetical protein C8F04DRAFT_1255819 [Mycena alexandri]|uniref:Ribonuclease H1 N-terminal domain-containing protein n=1 Tax=Mycena alexandri TaxID=1745969 RepID=A0AAD6X876_9AGAR|nr:hypothetical protein C8F04DRAFT_1255819 [Mycena alexandri]
MTELSDSPREYTDADFAALIAGLNALDLTRTPSPPVTEPPAYEPPQTPRTPTQTPTRLYEVESPSRNGYTAAWSEASHLTQGVAGARVQAVRLAPSPHPKRRAYTVFYGHRPGVFEHWEVHFYYKPAGAEAQVKGVKGDIYQGYSSRREAEAAYRYAWERGWTMVRPSSSSNPQPPIPALPESSQSPVDGIPNPLHGSAASNPRWHVVYAGINPGVYVSYLECALNTLGLKPSAYQSANLREEAEQYWVAALANGDVRVLTHTYHVA